MLLIITLFIITMFCIILIYCNYKFWDIDAIELLANIFSVISGIILFISLLLLMIIHCSAPNTQAEYEERYYKLEQKAEHIDSFNKQEIIEEVNKWNKEYRTNIYGKNSQWINWFYTIDTSTTDLIKIDY